MHQLVAVRIAGTRTYLDSKSGSSWCRIDTASSYARVIIIDTGLSNQTAESISIVALPQAPRSIGAHWRTFDLTAAITYKRSAFLRTIRPLWLHLPSVQHAATSAVAAALQVVPDGQQDPEPQEEESAGHDDA